MSANVCLICWQKYMYILFVIIYLNNPVYNRIIYLNNPPSFYLQDVKLLVFFVVNIVRLGSHMVQICDTFQVIFNTFWLDDPKCCHLGPICPTWEPILMPYFRFLYDGAGMRNKVLEIYSKVMAARPYILGQY